MDVNKGSQPVDTRHTDLAILDHWLSQVNLENGCRREPENNYQIDKNCMKTVSKQFLTF